jgi:hypothetical protein
MESAQIKSRVIKNALGFWIGGEQHLKSTIKQKPFNLVSPDASTNAIRRMENMHRNAGLVEPAGAA